VSLERLIQTDGHMWDLIVILRASSERAAEIREELEAIVRLLAPASAP
jgi:hypothetical protein